MGNILDNGTVLPHGLLGCNTKAMMAGFNKSYKNVQLRVGVIVATYPISDINNRSKLTTEYDVLVIEQNEDRGATTIQYKNCMAAEGMGSIADYFEKTLRQKEQKTTKGDSVNLSGQDGAIALLLCLDGMADKGIIIGAVTHPDRQTNLVDANPFLEGEYNGANIVVNEDGSTVFTFKGATNNDGSPVDPSQGNTTVSILTDGSFEVMHKTITLQLNKAGTINITSTDAITINTQADMTINCNNATIEAMGTATVDGQNVKLGKNATEAVIKGSSFQKYFNAHAHPTILGPSGPPISPMPANTLSTKVKTE